MLPRDATTYIAIYGAALASLTFIWNVTSWYRERGKLRVRLDSFEIPSTDVRRQISVRFQVTNVAANRS